MAKRTSVTVHYSEKRSGEYQSVEHGVTSTVEREDGDKAADVIAKETEYLKRIVSTTSYNEIGRLVEEYRNGRKA